MKLKELVLILISVIATVFIMYFIQVYVPKQIKDGEACYSVYLKK